jgi:vacuolar iron transporter family protein
MSEVREGLRTGLSFGLTSGVVTTLGLMVGLESGTNSMQAVVGGILTIAVADAMSDAFGVHVSQEAEGSASKREVRVATASAFLAKSAMASSFVVPVLLLPLRQAILASLCWGLVVIAALSYRMAKVRGEQPARYVSKHIGVALFVIALSHLVGRWVAHMFG